MLLKEDALVDEVPVPRELLLNDELGHVEHDLRAELFDAQELDDRL